MKQTNNLSLWKLLLIFSLPYLAASLIHNGFLALLPFIREAFELNRTQIGYYSTFTFISSATLAIFTGSVVDRLGPKKGVLIGVGCIGLASFFYGLVPSYNVLLFLALFAGLGFSIITPSLNKGLALAAPPEKRAVSMGIMQSGFGIGGIMGTGLIPILGVTLGWRVAIQVAAVFALIMGFLVFKLYREQKDPAAERPQADGETARLSFKNSLFSLFTNKPLLQICIFGIVLGSASNAALAHFAVFISEDLQMSPTIAGLGLSIYLLGGITGKITWGWASDALFRGKRKLALFTIALIIGSMYIFFGLFINNPQISHILIFISSFFLGYTADGWQGVHLAAVGDTAGKEAAGIATGLALLFLRAGLLIAPPVIGFIADQRGSYASSWLFFGLFVIVASALLYFLRAPLNSSS